MFEVSIVMPVYNVEDHLPRAIESALNQKKVLGEIILVNDGSTDKSGDICDDYAKKEPLLIKVIHQENQGSGPARNTGLKQATGKYIYFADPDDYFEPTLLVDNLKLAKKTDAEIVVFGYTQEKNNKPKDRQEFLPNIRQLPSQEEFRKHFRNFYYFFPYALWNKLYKKEFLEKNDIEFTNQKLGQDALFNIDVFKHLSAVSINRKAYYHYVTHEGSSVNRYRPDRFEMEVNIAEKFEKLLEEWSMKEEFLDLVAEEYFHPLYLETANLVHKDCPLTEEEKVTKLRDYWNTIGKAKILKHKKEDNPFRFALLREFKQERPKNALFLMKSRNRAANRYSKTFSKIRQFFKT